MIALRAFIDTETTRAPGFWARSSSASVGVSRLTALLPSRMGRPYVMSVVAGSAEHPVSRRSFLPLPPRVVDHAVRCGSAPVPIVAWPAHVTVTR